MFTYGEFNTDQTSAAQKLQLSVLKLSINNELLKVWKEMVVVSSHLVYRFYPHFIPFLSTNFLVSFPLGFLPGYHFLILYIIIIIFLHYSVFLVYLSSFSS